MIFCAGNDEIYEAAKPIGIGLTQSAINLTKLCCEQRPELIIFIGSAGSYGNAKAFDILFSKHAFQIESSQLENNSYSPIKLEVLSNVSRETIGEKDFVKTNSSNYITTDSTAAKKFLSLGLDIENMEFFSVLSVAKSFGIDAFGVFVVTNLCEKNAHLAYKENIKNAWEKLLCTTNKLLQSCPQLLL